MDDGDLSVIFTSRRLDRKTAPIETMERDKLISSQTTVRAFTREDISHAVHLVSNGKMIISRVRASASRRRAKGRKKNTTVMFCFLSSVINHRLNCFRFRAKQNVVSFFPDVRRRFQAERVAVPSHNSFSVAV